MKKPVYLLTDDNIEILAERIFNKIQKSQDSAKNNVEDELLTIEQAAKILKLSKATIYGLVHKKNIPYSKKNKRLYFQKSELIDWVRSGSRATKSSLQSKADEYLANNRLA